MELETEYNNRARCPGHEQVIASWIEQSLHYREACAGELDIAYGSDERHRYDLFSADNSDASKPLTVFIHGGYWQALDRKMFSHMAAGVNAHGLDMAVPSYRLAPEVSIADIIDDMRAFCLHLFKAHGRKLVVCGHSAGGHLAAALFATDWQTFGGPERLVSAGLGISGLYDLRPLMPIELNSRIGIDLNIAQGCSPLLWQTPPAGRFEAWVGGDESAEYLRQSQTLAACWLGAGLKCNWVPVGKDNHFTVVRHLVEPDSDMTRCLVSMCDAA